MAEGLDDLASNIPTIMKAIRNNSIDQMGLLLAKPPASFFEYEYPEGLITSEAISMFHFAAKHNRDRICDMLLRYENGVDPNSRNSKTGYTVMHIAAENGFTELMDVMVAYNTAVDIQDMRGLTPLWRAVMSEQLPCAEILVKHGADVRVQNEDGMSLLHFVIAQGRSKAQVEVFVNAGLNVNAGAGVDSKAPLHLAVEKESQESEAIISFLIERGADVHVTDANGAVPLHLAAENGCVSHVQKLLDAKTNINSLNKDGRNALHGASERGHVEVVKLLLKNTINFRLADSKDKTALDLAMMNNHQEVVDAIKSLNKTKSSCCVII